MLLFLCTFTVSSICYASVNEVLTHECLKKYLKDREIYEDILEYVDSFVGSLTNCESAVKTKLAEINDNLRNELSRDRLTRPYVECVMRDVEEEDETFEKVKLRETAVDMISNWRFWKYFSKSSRLDELRAKAKQIVDKSVVKCKGHRQFGDMFTDISDHTIEWNRSGEQEFCIRKVLVEKGLLNDKLYDFKPNPRNVREEKLVCKDVFEMILNDFYERLKSDANLSDCVINKYRENGYAENVLKAEVLSKLTLSRSDKSKERQNFINSMVDVTYDARSC